MITIRVKGANKIFKAIAITVVIIIMQVCDIRGNRLRNKGRHQAR